MQKTTADGHRCPQSWAENGPGNARGAANPSAEALAAVMAQMPLLSPVLEPQKSSPQAACLCDIRE